MTSWTESGTARSMDPPQVPAAVTARIGGRGSSPSIVGNAGLLRSPILSSSAAHPAKQRNSSFDRRMRRKQAVSDRRRIRVDNEGVRGGFAAAQPAAGGTDSLERAGQAV